MKRIELADFRENVLQFVARVRRTGAPVIITHDGDEIARLVPAKRRVLRRLRDALWFVIRAKKQTGPHRAWGLYLKMR